ncbi:TRAP-type C4-dicarboxylate transport system, substrate-binding protein [Celeribacter baekdonensis]|jgi:TRAP-type C4-dicarboxylate transport system substrate-binding protein|uniref:TRAP-type C4-dicarboxylate transport system, substrate-binding protein n=1 Tax=Celeribacter baekdonensis TaxID=875171 RepID=A0A1G7H0J3_9RHOB|nr:TRAP transporter substrate-binding protein [Celeribacter baekdonensis]SDE93952.1 TRAP-type C4-dicarboxylate transport system, substrate-binding protein [Celeribacter baekdonensis]
MTTMTRRMAMTTLGAALATPAFLKKAHAAEVTLRVHHFLPGVAPMQTRFFDVWAKEISEASGGAIEMQMFPSMQLGGKPPQLADQARQGICDIAWTLPVYTPDRFPVAETMAMPFMVTNAEKTSVAMHTLMEEFGQNEYKGMKPLAFHTHDGGKIHTRGQIVSTAEDIKGLKLRAPNQATGEMLALMGAETVFFPVTEMVVGLSNGVIDGCCLPYEVVPAFKLQELTKVTNEPEAGGRGIYANTFALVMNERKYEGLSDDLRAVIDAHSGADLSRRLGAQFDEFEAFGKSVVEKQGNEIHTIAASEIDTWREMATPIYDKWIGKLNDAGHDGAAIVARANALLDAG